MCGHYCSACCQATEPLGPKSRHCSVCCKNSQAHKRWKEQKRTKTISVNLIHLKKDNTVSLSRYDDAQLQKSNNLKVIKPIWTASCRRDSCRIWFLQLRVNICHWFCKKHPGDHVLNPDHIFLLYCGVTCSLAKNTHWKPRREGWSLSSTCTNLSTPDQYQETMKASKKTMLMQPNTARTHTRTHISRRWNTLTIIAMNRNRQTCRDNH